MSVKLQLLQRRMERQQERIPVPASDDLSAAIERLVQERVDQAMEEQQPPAHVQRLLDRQFAKPKPVTSFDQLPPVQKPDKKPAEFETVWHRDGSGRIAWAETVCNGVSFKTVVQRDGGGNIVRTKTTTDGESPVLPPPDIPFKAKAREYKEGV